MTVVPVELLHEIFSHVLVFEPVSVVHTHGASSKPQWELVRSLSLASKAFRNLTLEAWFRVFVTRTPSDLTFVEERLPGIYSWAREFHCISAFSSVSGPAWDLQNFLRLHTIRLDCPSFDFNKIPLQNVPPTVFSLDLRGMIWPAPYAFEAIANLFPELRTMRMSQKKIWCGLCHTCSQVKFAGSVPQSLIYNDGLGLPIHYAWILSSLKHLQSVTIAVPFSTGVNVSLNLSDPLRDLWAGECDRCVGILYGDEEFRERWIARKKGTLADDSFGRGYRKPPALEIVEWAFWASPGNLEVEEDDEELLDFEGDDDSEADEIAELVSESAGIPDGSSV
ncbi:hypothetical protein R3P38DRAFT_2859033 [Favolaschia claudopus]|uniref:F-box domain-containing protein n=1 Tax=Favolaschia claudopus TaxID=2862362 RepID=A0AAW0DM66_9AGAR